MIILRPTTSPFVSGSFAGEPRRVSGRASGSTTCRRYPVPYGPRLTAFMLLLLPCVALAQQPLPAEGDESELLALLDSDAELFEKAKACQRLAIIGTSKSVPVVAKLLADPSLSHYARTALESNPLRSSRDRTSATPT